MILRRPAMLRCHRRRGAAAVEFALVALLLFQIILGMFEFCRFMYLRQVMEAAVRVGARVAVAGTNDPTITVTSIQTLVMTRMAGQYKQLNNHTTTTNPFTVSDTSATSDVRVFRADSTGLVPTALQRDAKGNVVLDGSGNPTPAPQTVNTWWLAPYTDAQFGDLISVQIVCTYRPIIGQLIRWAPTVPVQITATMTSEGN